MPANFPPRIACSSTSRNSFENWVAPRADCQALVRARSWLNSGEQGNWLGILGAPVSGKTHFLHALAHEAISTYPATRAAVRSFEYLLNSPTSIIQNFLTSDLLLIDDVGRDTRDVSATMDRVFFCSSRLVFTAQRTGQLPPSLLERTKEHPGVWIHLRPASFRAQLQIARVKCTLLGIAPSRPQLRFIVRGATNLRHMEGTLIRLARAWALSAQGSRAGDASATPSNE